MSGAEPPTVIAAPNPIPETARLALVGGKGGVGKTTVAAALAIEVAEARPRDRVLVLSTDPAHSLGDALHASLSDEARTFADGPPNLEARELDATAAWEGERERYRQSIDDLFSSIFRGRMDAAFDRTVMEDLLDLAPPGIDELFAIVTLLDALVRERAYDLVIVDTAPTGHTLRLLALPEKALQWVHSLMSVLLKYRNVVGLGELASDLTDLARRLRTLIALLRDPAQAVFVIVTRPAALPRLETERLVRDLRRLEMSLAAIVANAVTPVRLSRPHEDAGTSGCSRCTAAAEQERPELERLERLASRAPGASLVIAPAVYPAPRGVSGLRRWRSRWL